jgi:hypothetical protein
MMNITCLAFIVVCFCFLADPLDLNLKFMSEKKDPLDLNLKFMSEKKMLRHCFFFFSFFVLFHHACFLFGCRSTRETTPCSLIRSPEMISTPGSTTKSKTSSNSTTSRRRTEETPSCRFIPSSLEMEEFFSAAEQQEQHSFREK